MAANVIQQVQAAIPQAQAAIQSVIGTAAQKAAKPLVLYAHAGGPNPWKVAIILNELELPYTTVVKDFPDLKKPDFEALNPNGRVPALEDPNTGITTWESGACIEYLLETYDVANKLGYAAGEKKWQAKCWMHFQMSGQGPYFGQRAWFMLYHPEKNLTSCLDRYGNEIRRVIGVIDAHLKKQGTPYLVGDKVTYADLMWMPWHWMITQQPHMMGEEFLSEWKEKYPTAWAWNEKVSELESVKKAAAARGEAIANSKK